MYMTVIIKIHDNKTNKDFIRRQDFFKFFESQLLQLLFYGDLPFSYEIINSKKKLYKYEMKKKKEGE